MKNDSFAAVCRMPWDSSLGEETFRFGAGPSGFDHDPRAAAAGDVKTLVEPKGRLLVHQFPARFLIADALDRALVRVEFDAIETAFNHVGVGGRRLDFLPGRLNEFQDAIAAGRHVLDQQHRAGAGLQRHVRLGHAQARRQGNVEHVGPRPTHGIEDHQAWSLRGNQRGQRGHALLNRDMARRVRILGELGLDLPLGLGETGFRAR